MGYRFGISKITLFLFGLATPATRQAATTALFTELYSVDVINCCPRYLCAVYVLLRAKEPMGN